MIDIKIWLKNISFLKLCTCIYGAYLSLHVREKLWVMWDTHIINFKCKDNKELEKHFSSFILTAWLYKSYKINVLYWIRPDNED